MRSFDLSLVWPCLGGFERARDITTISSTQLNRLIAIARGFYPKQSWNHGATMDKSSWSLKIITSNGQNIFHNVLKLCFARTKIHDSWFFKNQFLHLTCQLPVNQKKGFINRGLLYIFIFIHFNSHSPNAATQGTAMIMKKLKKWF